MRGLPVAAGPSVVVEPVVGQPVRVVRPASKDRGGHARRHPAGPARPPRYATALRPDRSARAPAAAVLVRPPSRPARCRRSCRWRAAAGRRRRSPTPPTGPSRCGRSGRLGARRRSPRPGSMGCPSEEPVWLAARCRVEVGLPRNRPCGPRCGRVRSPRLVMRHPRVGRRLRGPPGRFPVVRPRCPPLPCRRRHPSGPSRDDQRNPGDNGPSDNRP